MAVRAYIDPKEFRSWCEHRGLPLDSRGRGEYANQAAHDTYMSSMEPTPVRVVFPNGHSEIGIQLAPTIVELSAAGLLLELHDQLQIDDRLVFVTAVNKRIKSGAGPDGTAEATVRVSFDAVRA
jgi:hypothetical protein